MVHLLHYALIDEFKKQFFKDVLSQEHVVGHQIKIDKLSFPDGGVDESANFWGYEFAKGGVKYLVPSKMKDEEGNEKEISLNDILPVAIKNLKKVAARGIVYYQLKKISSARIRPVKHFGFRTLLDSLSSIPHSNPTHYKLMWFIEIAQIIDRCNVRVCSPPGFGKDSTVSIMNSLTGLSTTIENPSVAKLCYISTYKHVAVNEVVGVTKDQWRAIEIYLLATGAFKTTFMKPTRAIESGTEEIDISKLSLSLFYNDIDNYAEEKYFDSIAKGAVSDRFVPLRVYGTFTDDFKTIPQQKIGEVVKRNYDKYKQLNSTIVYYKLNYMTEYHAYETNKLIKLPQRWNLNISTVLRIVDLYCETQEEFNEWIDVINKCIEDYFDMIKFPTTFKKFVVKEFGMRQEDIQKLSIREIIESLPHTSSHKNSEEFISRVMKQHTFTERNRLLRGFNNEQDTQKENHGFW